MSLGSDIAAEVAAALGEAGEATGSGPLIGTIRRTGIRTGGTDYAPIYAADSEHSFTVVLGTFSDSERSGTPILSTDVKIICSVGDVVPLVEDKILVAGNVYDVYGVNPTNPGGVDILYAIWARA